MLAKWIPHHSGIAILTVALILLAVAAFAVSYHANNTWLADDAVIVDQGVLVKKALDLSGSKNERVESRVLSHVEFIKEGGILELDSGKIITFPSAIDEDVAKLAERVELAYRDSRFEDVGPLFTEMVDAHRAFADARIDRLVMLQIIAGIIITIGLLYVLLSLFSRMIKASSELEKVTFENERILGTVKDGLFLIDERGQISSVQSAETQFIFARGEPIKGDFFAFIKPYVSETDLVDTYDYVALLREGRGRQSLLVSLNPLQEVELSLGSSANQPQQKKIISFDFSRSKKNLKHGVLVSVRDITKEVTLRRELDNANANNQERMHVLLGSVAANAGDANMKSFYEDGFRLLQEANGLLENNQESQADSLEKMNVLVQKIHRLKSNASSMGVGLIEASCDHIETKIQELKAMPELDGEHVFGLSAQLKKIFGELEFLQQLTKKLDLNTSEHSNRSLNIHGIEPTLASDMHNKELGKLQRFAREVAERHDKLVSIDVYGFQELPLETSAAAEIESVCIQLVRNSIVHGIEKTESRRRQNKPSIGQIIVALREQDKEWLALTIRDDGAGLDLKDIRARAIKKGLVSFDSAAELKAGGIVRLLFKPGFTTRDEADIDGGRGFGLDVVKTVVAGLGGKIGVKSRKKHFCEVTIELPKSLLMEGRVR